MRLYRRIHVTDNFRHIIPISGKDSAATAIVQKTRQPELNYEFIYNETMAELPEVDTWLSRMEVFLEAPIARIGANLEDIIYEQGILPSFHKRFCTRLAKIYPMEDWVAKEDRPAKIYFGIRADEQRVGYESKRSSIIPVYPLQELGIDIDLVYSILDKEELAPPDFMWNSLFEMIYDQLGYFVRNDALSRLTRSQKTNLFCWRSRMNCYYCFNQQVWEWVGLLEHHPDLFEKAEIIENQVGAEGYTWRQDWSLKRIRSEAESIKARRAKRVINRIITTAFKIEDGEEDQLGLVSCGLFCGK